MTGRRLFMMVALLLGLTIQASALPFTFNLPVILQLTPGANITTVVAALGGTLVDNIPGTNTYLVNVPLVPSLFSASLLGIQSAELNLGVILPTTPLPLVMAVPPNTASDWYKYQPPMLLIRSGEALAYSTGRGVVIADLNSQVDVRHPALIGHLTTGYDFVAARPGGSTALNQSSSSFMDQSSSSFMDQSSSSFMDQFGATILNQSSSSFMDAPNPGYSHGTLCAGVIAVVAPDSMIMPLRVFDEDGSADFFTIAKAIRYAVQQGAQVVNMSFGTFQNSTTIKNAVNYALSQNVVLVASAGNRNTSSPQYPAAYTGVITTAATNLQDVKASFSNFGSNIFIDAPGVNIFSTYPGGYYSMVSGTSFSAPITAGAAALVRAQLDNDVKDNLANGAINIDSNNPQYAGELGYGRIDVLQTVQPH